MAMGFMRSLSFHRSPYDGYNNMATAKPETVVSDTEEEDDSSSCDHGDVSEFNRHSKSSLSTHSTSLHKQSDSYVSQSCLDTARRFSYKPRCGGPFSGLTPSMWPQDLLAIYSQPEDCHPTSNYDEYGFIVSRRRNVDINPSDSMNISTTGNDSGGSGGGSSGLGGGGGGGGGCGGESDEYSEDGFMVSKRESELRNKWIAYLEFTYNEAALPRMLWSQVETQIRHTKVCDQLVKDGIPSTMRPQLWLHFSKGLIIKSNSKKSYAHMCEQSNHVESIPDKQILSVLPTNACFMHPNSVGVERLRRILRVIKWLHRSGSNSLSTSTNDTINIPVIAAHLLLFCDEEDAFWLTLSCLNELKTFDHQNVLKKLLTNYCSSIDELLKKDGLEINLITSHWFSSLFAGYITPTSVLIRLWDFYFYYGSIVLFQLTIGILVELSHTFENCDDTGILFNRLSDLPTHINDCDRLISFWETGARYVDHVKQDNISLNIVHLNNLGASLLTIPTFTSESTKQDPKTKNIRQTSLLLELHESIVAIGRHFETHDSKFKANLDPDYNHPEYLDDDTDHYDRPPQQMRRAKALIDFQRHDPDELGFRKNDIILILSERDEHCWIGELNGIQGWFPAKFVELLDERNGEYCVAGDDRVVPYINDLVRGRFCSVFKAILCHGLQRSFFVVIHPWNVIETVVKTCIESDFNTVYSRLVLTRTFRLDEFARVLNPTEILYRTIAHINQTLANEPLDIKLRSLVVIGLNQKILHEWFTIICATQPHIISRYYHNWSFINSPVWKMIKAELR